jgi:hypothetical protein
MGKHIEVHIGLALALAVVGTSGCFQQLDTGASGGPFESTVFRTPGDAGGGGGGGGDTLPAAFDAGDLALAESNTVPCSPGSALCYQLCGSPACALQNNTIVPYLGTTPALLPDGGDAPSSCDQINALSQKVRERSCGPCHGPPPAPGVAGFSWVLDDTKISSMQAPGYMTPAVIPGDPDDSPIVQRILLRLKGSPDLTGMPPPSGQLSIYLTPTQVSAFVYPTAEDFSVLYTWIMACVPGADAGAFDNQYGGNYGPPSLDGGDK